MLAHHASNCGQSQNQHCREEERALVLCIEPSRVLHVLFDAGPRSRQFCAVGLGERRLRGPAGRRDMGGNRGVCPRTDRLSQVGGDPEMLGRAGARLKQELVVKLLGGRRVLACGRLPSRPRGTRRKAAETGKPPGIDGSEESARSVVLAFRYGCLWQVELASGRRSTNPSSVSRMPCKSASVRCSASVRS